LAAAAAAGGDFSRAARLLGAASALREAIGTAALLPSVRTGHNIAWAAVEKALGPAEAGRAVAEGRTLSLEELV
jgi:hypothetical protein